MFRFVMTILLLLCILFISSVDKGDTLQEKKQWKLVWADEFDQIEGIDTLIWSKIPRGRSPWKRYMSDFDSCYTIKNGNLVLYGIVNYTQKNDSSPYLTGGLYTKGRHLFKGGRIEVRAKLRGAQGAWPAIWMVAEDVPWPYGGEIDIMERVNHDNFVYQTAHSHYTYNLGIKYPDQAHTYSINPDDYNIYSVDIYPDRLVFSVNHNYNFTYPRIENQTQKQFPFYQSYYLLIDMQLGGAWTGKIDKAELPAEMWIDWVRYYKE